MADWVLDCPDLGKCIIGPFDTSQDARDYADVHAPDADWKITRLESPNA